MPFFSQLARNLSLNSVRRGNTGQTQSCPELTEKVKSTKSVWVPPLELGFRSETNSSDSSSTSIVINDAKIPEVDTQTEVLNSRSASSNVIKDAKIPEVDTQTEVLNSRSASSNVIKETKIPEVDIQTEVLNSRSASSNVIKEAKIPEVDIQTEVLNSRSASSNVIKEAKIPEVSKIPNPRYPRHPEVSSCRSANSTESATTHSVLCEETYEPHYLVKKAMATVGELESSLIEDHQQLFQVRIALERKTEEVRVLSSSLEAERKRGQELIKLIRSIDDSYGTDDDNDHEMLNRYTENGGAGRRRDHAVASISPLLMEARYDELNASYQRLLGQLVKKEKALAESKSEKEAAQANFVTLLDSFRNLQGKFEDMGHRYLRLQARKREQIEMLKNTVNRAGDCILVAQKVVVGCNCIDRKKEKEFKSNLKLFLRALRQCGFIKKHNSSSNDNSSVGN